MLPIVYIIRPKAPSGPAPASALNQQHGASFPQTHGDLMIPYLCALSSLSLECLSLPHGSTPILPSHPSSPSSRVTHSGNFFYSFSRLSHDLCPASTMYCEDHPRVSICGPALSLPFVYLSLPWDCALLGVAGSGSSLSPLLAAQFLVYGGTSKKGLWDDHMAVPLSSHFHLISFSVCNQDEDI